MQFEANATITLQEEGFAMWVTGSCPRLGSWDKQNALQMARNARGDWEVSFPHPDPEEPMQYKYFLRDRGLEAVWTSPKTRSYPSGFSVMDPRARPPTTRVVDAIAADELTQLWQL